MLARVVSGALCATLGWAVACTAQETMQSAPSDRTGTVVVLNKAEASAWLIDAATGEVVARIPTGDGPHEVAVSPDGTRAVVGDYGGPGTPGRSLTLIDLPGKRVAGKVDLGEHRRPHGIAWLPDGRIAVTSETSQAVLLVDPEAGRVVRTLPTGAGGSHMLAASADGTRIYTANLGNNTVTALHVDSAAALGVASAGRGSEGLALSPDGSQVWVGNRQDNTVTVVDTRTMQPVATLPSAVLPFRVAFTPDGSRAIVANPMSGHLRVFDVAGRTEAAAIHLAYDTPGVQGAPGRSGHAVPLGLTISGDGRWAYASDGEAQRVAVVDLREGRLVALFPAGASPDGIAWSPVVVR